MKQKTGRVHPYYYRTPLPNWQTEREKKIENFE